METQQLISPQFYQWAEETCKLVNITSVTSGDMNNYKGAYEPVRTAYSHRLPVIMANNAQILLKIHTNAPAVLLSVGIIS